MNSQRVTGNITDKTETYAVIEGMTVENFSETVIVTDGTPGWGRLFPAKNGDRVEVLAHRYQDEISQRFHIIVDEIVELVPAIPPEHAPCPSCGANTGTSEGHSGRCQNCGYEL